jgi:hypothetical protein
MQETATGYYCWSAVYSGSSDNSGNQSTSTDQECFHSPGRDHDHHDDYGDLSDDDHDYEHGYLDGDHPHDDHYDRPVHVDEHHDLDSDVHGDRYEH